jgi:hypothetical protein
MGGMVETHMKKIPDGVGRQEAFKRIHNWIAGMDEDSDVRITNSDVRILKEAEFEEAWEHQENLKKEPEIKEKYRLLAKEEKVLYIEIVW